MPQLLDNYQKSTDRRAIRSRASIISALNKLLLDDKTSDLSVNSIVQAAGVGRSTFYEHFRNLDALIQAAIAPLFDDLARASLNSADPDRQHLVLEHLWTKRRLARVLLVGRRAEKMTEVLTTSYKKALAEQRNAIIPLSYDDNTTVTFLAAGTISILREWLSGHLGADITTIATVLAKQGSAYTHFK